MSEKKPLPSAETLRRFKDKNPCRARSLILLALSAALALFLFALIRPQGGPEGEEAERTAYVLIERDRTLLGSITVAISGSDPYTLVNRNDYDLSDKNDVLGEEYALEGDPDFAVSTARVLPMERYASDLTVEDMAARTPGDLDQYGLKKPSMTVTIDYRDGARTVLHFGGPVPTGGCYYLQHEGDSAVYVAAESIYEAFHRPLSELEQTAEEKASLAAAREVETAEPDETETAALPPKAGAAVQPETPDASARQARAGATARPGAADASRHPETTAQASTYATARP